MSLVRLLKAGKSLTDLHNSTSRYRMRSRFLLPKFGSTKNPFSAPVPVEVIQAAAEGTPAVERYQKSPAELSAARLKETAKLPDNAPVENPPAVEPATVPAPRRRWFNRSLFTAWVPWAQKLNPFGWRPKRSAAPKPPASRPGRSPVQAELSLDNIKVMRNDLSDADVEIVAVRPPVKMKSESAGPKTRKSGAMTPALVETQPG